MKLCCGGGGPLAFHHHTLQDFCDESETQDSSVVSQNVRTSRCFSQEADDGVFRGTLESATKQGTLMMSALSVTVGGRIVLGIKISTVCQRNA